MFFEAMNKNATNPGPFKKRLKVDRHSAKIFITSVMLLFFCSFLAAIFLCDSWWNSCDSWKSLHSPQMLQVYYLYKSKSESAVRSPQLFPSSSQGFVLCVKNAPHSTTRENLVPFKSWIQHELNVFKLWPPQKRLEKTSSEKQEIRGIRSCRKKRNAFSLNTNGCEQGEITTQQILLDKPSAGYWWMVGCWWLVSRMAWCMMLVWWYWMVLIDYSIYT